tara:strand:+ start:7001 stop:7147 length:147 start_codon:yes stop_codon:yes gene_type:complete
MLKFLELVKNFFDEIFTDVYFGFTTEREQVMLVGLFIFIVSIMVFIVV